MTKSQDAGTTTRHTLSERENQHAVEMIEAAERSAPYCACGSHMLAVARGDEVWLECAEDKREKGGVAGLVARLTAFTHTRRMVMQLHAD
jgi:hypothetical protein